MAAEIVRSGKTTSAAATSLAITSPAPGNTLVMAVSQTASAVAIVPSDNLGTAGWKVVTTLATSSAGANSVQIAYKVAIGTETTLNGGAAGTGQGVEYWECTGIEAALDGTPVVTNNQASGKAVTSPTMKTTTAGIIFAVVGDGTAAFGVPGALTPAGAVLVGNTAEERSASSRILGASYIPGAGVEQAFTENWETARVSGILVVGFKASGKKTVEEAMSARTGAVASAAAKKVAVGAVSAVSGALAKASAVKIATGSTAARTGAIASLTATRAVQGSLTAVTGARASTAGKLVATGATGAVTGARAATSGRLVATGSMRAITGALVTITVSGRKIVEGSMSAVAGAIVAAPAVKVATGAVSARTGAVATVAAKRVVQGALTATTGARLSAPGRKIAVGQTLAVTGARLSTSSSARFASAMRAITGVIVRLSSAEPPPPTLKPGPITLGEDRALVMGTDLGPTTGEAR